VTSTTPYVLAAVIAGSFSLIGTILTAAVTFINGRRIKSIDKSVNGIQPGDATIRENVQLLVEKQELAHEKFDLLSDKVDHIKDETAGIRRRVERLEKRLSDDQEI
jgi:predicted  nucleic acid-binding Zn-ribbon protein